MGLIWPGFNRQIHQLAISVFFSASWGLQCLGRTVASQRPWGMPASLTRLLLKGAASLPALPCDKLLRKHRVRAKQWQVTVTELYKHVDN